MSRNLRLQWRHHTDATAYIPGPAGLPEKKRQHRAFVSARIALVLMFIGLWVTLTPAGYAMPPGFLAVLIAELSALLAFRLSVPHMRTAAAIDRAHVVLLVVEATAHSAMFYFLGGITWLGCIAYLYALMYAAVFLTWRQAAFFTAVICAAFLTIVTLDGTAVLPHQDYLPQGPDRYKDLQFIVPSAAGFVGVAFTVTFWMVFIGNEIRRERDIAIKAYDELARTQAELSQLNDELENKVFERTKVLAFRAEHDTLTGLLNRGSISRRCHDALALASRTGQKVAVIVADGDDFKSCNDRVGHSYGDEVLRVISETLRETTRESDYAGRLGGDEFLIVLQNTSALGAARYCRRLLRALEENQREALAARPGLPFPLLSLGVAVFPDHGTEVDELIRVADHAMYSAKANGGARWRIGSPAAAAGVRAILPARPDGAPEPVPTHPRAASRR